MRAPARPRHRACRGLSLLEVLVAMTILAMALLGLIPLFITGVKVNAASRDLALANALAKEKLEQLVAYPSTDKRLAIPSGPTMADPSNCIDCVNDLPTWHKPATGETATQAESPGAGWFHYPCTRTYTVQAFSTADLTTPVVSTLSDETPYNAAVPPAPYYAVKVVTVTVTPAVGQGLLPGLRTTTQSALVRYRNVS